MSLDFFSKFKARDLLVRRIFLVLADIVGMLFSFWLVSFAFRIYPSGTQPLNLTMSIILTVVNIIIYVFGGLYSSLWEYSGTRELLQIALSTLVATGVDLLIGVLLDNRLRFVQYIFVWVILLVMSGGLRLSYRLVRMGKNWLSAKSRRDNRRLLLIGAGSNGALLAGKLQDGTLKLGTPIVFLDDKKRKIGRRVHGIKVFGELSWLEMAIRIHSIDEVIVTEPNLPPEKLKKIYDTTLANGCTVKVAQTLENMLVDEVEEKKVPAPLIVRNIDVNDLLGRKSLEINTERVKTHVSGQTVLITGGGGSIGSEIARQIARYRPSTLVLFDIYENQVFDLANQLIQKYDGKLTVFVEVGSIQDKVRVDRLFKEYQPAVVFHAAAHKHVPLMERSPGEAIKNNVFGTYNVATAADRFGVDRFVLISTDKAVNPTSTMGATKALAERIVQSLAQYSATKFACVRFGNVLDSSGSVIPIFRRQLAAGGPLTVTDKNMVRYFMTIPEAASLVIEAAAMAEGGEIYILNMGHPVRILDLAENMIRLSDLEPYKDVEIVFTGLRPGEKLYEELNPSDEPLQPTDNPDIMSAIPHPVEREEIQRILSVLESCIELSNKEIKRTIKELVPTYHIDELNTD